MYSRSLTILTVNSLLALILGVIGCVRKGHHGTFAPNVTKTLSPLTTPRSIDISHIEPGMSAILMIAGRKVEISVPDDEGFSIGSFQISEPSTGFIKQGMLRDGAIHQAWIGDVTSDGIEDAVIVIKSAGSGSYADVFIMETTATNFVITRLPEFTTSGYMGHDTVSIQNGSIVRSFPTYVDEDKIRIDRQWKLRDVFQGKLPIRKERDSNASPSGATLTFKYDRKTGWLPL